MINFFERRDTLLARYKELRGKLTKAFHSMTTAQQLWQQGKMDDDTYNLIRIEYYNLSDEVNQLDFELGETNAQVKYELSHKIKELERLL